MPYDVEISPTTVERPTPSSATGPAATARLPITSRIAAMQAGASIGDQPRTGAQLILCYGGVLRLRAGGDVWFIPTKHGIWIPGALGHELTAQTPLEVHHLRFDARIARHVDLPDAPVVVGATPLLRGIAQRLSGQSAQSLTRAEARRLAWVTFDEIGRLDRPDLRLPGGHDRRLAAVMDHLVRTPRDRRGLPELARDVGTSARTLERLFVAETGLTFGKWRRRLRFMVALERIGLGERTTTIAADLGYATPSSFIAAFKAHFGQPPSAFRRWQ